MIHRPSSAKWLVVTAVIGSALTACDSDVAIMPDTAIENRVTQPSADNSVSASDAHNVASIFYADRNNGIIPIESRGTDEALPITDQNGATLAWIVNYPEGGWAVVSATKSYFPVLAYSDDGNLTINGQSENAGFSAWISDIEDAVSHSSTFDSQTASMIDMEWHQYEPAMTAGGVPGGNSPEAVACRNRLKVLNDTYYQDGWSFTTLPSASITIPEDVYSTANSCGSPIEYTIVGVRDRGHRYELGPLMTTCWKQYDQFNALCEPYDPRYPKKYPAGCTTIAVAQIMRYHRFPTTYDWDAMRDSVPTYASQRLIADIADSINVKFGEKESFANIDDVVRGLDHYGYSVTKKDHKASDVVNEIVGARRPVYMRGESASGGKHAWVCNGVSHIEYRYEYYAEYLCNGSYDNLGSSLEDPSQTGIYSFPYYFYMNWGLGHFTEEGKANGWYLDTELPTYRNYKNDRENLYIRR